MEFNTTGPVGGAACMCEGVLRKHFDSSSYFLKDFIFRQKKRTKKVFLSIRENINMYLSQKEGELFILGLIVQKEESADDILFNF